MAPRSGTLTSGLLVTWNDRFGRSFGSAYRTRSRTFPSCLIQLVVKDKVLVRNPGRRRKRGAFVPPLAGMIDSLEPGRGSNRNG
jgi:hypothetical protein